MDFGLGIGYNPDSNSSSHTAPSRSAAVNSLRTGMMAQFKSNFVAASSPSENQSLNGNSSAYANKRPTLSGFVSGGSIGGDINISRAQHQATSTFSSAQNSNEYASQKSERLNSLGLGLFRGCLVHTFLVNFLTSSSTK